MSSLGALLLPLETTRDNGAEFERLLSCLAEGNQEWARNAPVLMLSVAKLYFERNGVENRHAFHDVGAAAAKRDPSSGWVIYPSNGRI